MGRQTATAVQLKPEDYRLLAEFRRLLRQFLVFSEQQALGVGLAPQQHQALLAIKGSPDGPPTVGDLAERLAIRHNKPDQPAGQCGLRDAARRSERQAARKPRFDQSGRGDPDEIVRRAPRRVAAHRAAAQAAGRSVAKVTAWVAPRCPTAVRFTHPS